MPKLCGIESSAIVALHERSNQNVVIIEKRPVAPVHVRQIQLKLIPWESDGDNSAKQQ
jgi:hypothetical protein